MGFREWKEAGMIERIPRLVGVQSVFCAPLYQASRKGWRETRPIKKEETIAEGIAISEPVRGRQILEAIQEMDGEILVVTGEEIGMALMEMGRKGHFSEPTSAATIAGLKKYLRKRRRREGEVPGLTP